MSITNTYEIIFYKIRNKHPKWSNKKITVCTRYAYRKSRGKCYEQQN